MAVAQPSSPAFGTANLSNCEREQIHLAGSIQPHGALLVVGASDPIIVQASENAAAYLGIDTKLQGLRLRASRGNVCGSERADVSPIASRLSRPPYGARSEPATSLAPRCFIELQTASSSLRSKEPNPPTIFRTSSKARCDRLSLRQTSSRFATIARGSFGI